MRTVCFLCLFSLGAWAQSTYTLAVPAGPATPAAAVPVTVIVTTAAGSTLPAALQFSLNYTAADVASVTAVPGTAATAAGKGITCAGSPGVYQCVVNGINVAEIGNGPVAVLSLHLSPSITAASTPVSLTNDLGASLAGSAIPVASVATVLIPMVSGPTITGSSLLPNAVVGVAYSFVFTAAGSLPITWAATGLPSWAVLSSSGLLTGVPNAAGTSVLNVTATNAAGSAGPVPFNLTVAPVNINTTISVGGMQLSGIGIY